MQGAIEPTRGQLERELSQRILAWYLANLGHQPGKVSCQVFDGQVAILIEGAITQPEQLLVNSGKDKLAERVRSNIDKAIQRQLKQLIEEVMGLPVKDLLIESAIQTGRMSTVAVLGEKSKFCNPSLTPESPAEAESN